MKEWLLVGLGNPILGDDGVGWRVCDHVQRWLNEEGESYRSAVDIVMLSLGGLSLMEHMVGYQGVILIDAIESAQHPVGHVSVFPLTDLTNPSIGHTTSAHDTSLLTALETGRRMGLTLPNTILVVAIEARKLYDFSESLSVPIAAAVPLACQRVIALLHDLVPVE